MTHKYILIHEHGEGVTSYPFTSKSKMVAANHSEAEVAQILGVNYEEHKEERLTLCRDDERPLNFDALLEAGLKKQAE